MVYLGLAEEDGRYDSYDDALRGGRRVTTGAPAPPSPRCPPARRRSPVSSASPRSGTLNRITTIHPRTYNEAKAIGESFREGTPVIMNLTDMDDADAKRLVDFAAGLVFGLQWLHRAGDCKVFLLSPAHVEVAAEEPAGPHGVRGPFNQS
jgi:cell division inhibitor SepF